MKTLSIRQPWAWLIVNGHKDIENRTWRTAFRGMVLIHASKGMTRADYDACLTFVESSKDEAMYNASFLIPSMDDLQRGGIIGQAKLVDCVEASTSPWFTGPYGFLMRDAKPLSFTPVKGQLGFFEATTLYDQFIEYIYEHHRVWNGDRLVTLMEDGDIQKAFLEYADLPEDTELEP